MQNHRIISSLRKLHKIDLCVFINAKKIFPAKMDLGPTITGSQLIAGNDRKIDSAFFISHIFGSLDKNISLHIIQTGKRIAVIFFLGGGETKGCTQGQTQDDEYSLFFHLSSFPIPKNAKSMPFVPPLNQHSLLS